MSADGFYRALLRAYPPTFRARYEREMMLAFRQCRHDADGRMPQLWVALLWDVARSAPALHLDAIRARWGMESHFREAAMKTMAILAMLVGAVEVINSLIEGVGGGLHRDGLQLLSVVLCLVGGAVLVVAGIAMLRRGVRATSTALGMAAACLVAFVVIGLAAPVMSGFSMLLGIGFPIALLAFLLSRRGRGEKLPGVA